MKRRERKRQQRGIRIFFFMCVGCTKERIFLTYDVFVREDSSLTHPLPCWMKVTDWTVVDVSFFFFLFIH